MTVFVGRAAELGALDQGLAAARGGDGGLILIHGDPGMGKSALAAQAVRLAHAAGMRTRWGRCLEGEGAAPYRPWTQILADLDATDLTEASDTDSRFRLFDEVADALRRAAEPDGLLIVIDDLHWADVPSLRLLQVLASAVARSRLLVVGLYRRTEVHPRDEVAAVIGAVLREPAASSLPLSGLAPSEVASLIRQTLPAAPDGKLTRQTLPATPDDALIAAVERRAEGNPLFAVELARYAAIAGAADLPASVRGVIADRLGRLKPASREALRAAAVLGREFSAGQLATITREPVARAVEDVADAVAAELVTSAGALLFRFAHVLVREVAYAELPAAARQELHERAARAVPDPDMNAHHLRQAALLGADPGLLAEALEATVSAARAAGRRLAYEQAADLYRRALELSPTGHQELVLELARSEFRAGSVAAAWRSCQRAADLARARGDAATLAEAALVVRGLSNDPVCDQIHALCREALAVVGDGDPVLTARLLGQLAVTANRWAGGIEPGLSERAQAAADATGDPDARFLALQARYVALTDCRYTLDRLAIGERAVLLGREAGRDDYLAWGHSWRADAHWQLGRRVPFDTEVAAYAGVVAHLREPLARWRLTMMRACTALLEGRFARAGELADEALAIGARSTGSEHGEAGFLHVVFQSHLAALTGGDLSAVESFVRDAMARDGHTLMRAWLASVLADMDRLDEAAREWAVVRPHLAEFPRYTPEWIVNTAGTVSRRRAARMGPDHGLCPRDPHARRRRAGLRLPARRAHAGHRQPGGRGRAGHRRLHRPGRARMEQSGRRDRDRAHHRRRRPHRCEGAAVRHPRTVGPIRTLEGLPHDPADDRAPRAGVHLAVGRKAVQPLQVLHGPSRGLVVDAGYRHVRITLVRHDVLDRAHRVAGGIPAQIGHERLPRPGGHRAVGRGREPVFRLPVLDRGRHRRAPGARDRDVVAPVAQQPLGDPHDRPADRAVNVGPGPQRDLALARAQLARDLAAQPGKLPVERGARAQRGTEVPVPEDVVRLDVVLFADRHAQPHQRVPQRLRRRLGDVGALVFDPDRVDVATRAVRGLDLRQAGLERLEAAVPALEHISATADREVLARVGPAVDLLVQPLDVAGEPDRLLARIIRAVGIGRVVHDDFARRALLQHDLAGRRLSAPAVAVDDPGKLGAGRGVGGGSRSQLAAHDGNARRAQCGLEKCASL